MSRRTVSVDVIRIPTAGPGDVSGLIALIEAGKIIPGDILAVLGKTEGNGGVNDFTREYAVAALREALAPHLRLAPREVEERIAFVMSGGTEGVLSPHLTVFARSFAPSQPSPEGKISESSPASGAGKISEPSPASGAGKISEASPASGAGKISEASPASGGGKGGGNGGDGKKRLSIGIAHTRDFLPEELGRKEQIDETVKAVHLAMRDAGIDDPRDVHFVQIKCPLLTSERVEAAARRGHKTVTTSGYSSMGYSRGASALGVAVALGELKPVDEDRLLKDWDLFSSVASASAGIELMHNVVIVMGNSAASTSSFVIGHAMMRDAIDLAAVLEALKSVGLGVADASSNDRLVNIFAKAEASPDGAVRGFRHTMLDDSDVGSTRHARAAVGGLIGGLSGTGAVYVSGGAEHQGPPGGGPVAVIARV
jgi:cyanuric acid amidohydrolase